MPLSIYNLNALYKWYRMGRYPDIQDAIARMQQDLDDGNAISFKGINENGSSVELFKLYNLGELNSWIERNLSEVA